MHNSKPVQPTEPVGTLIDRLQTAGCTPRQSGDRFTAKCPAHDDSTASLSIGRGKSGQALIKCHAGCPTAEILARLDLRMVDLFPPRTLDPHLQARPRQPRTTTPSPGRQTDWDVMAKMLKCDEGAAAPLAEKLDVTAQSLEALDVGYASPDAVEHHTGRRTRSDAWLFPMRNAKGITIGICARSLTGQKWTLAGGHLGLFYPRTLHDLPDPVLIVEGASDVAAGLSMDCTCVGRPSAKVGAEMLAELLRGRQVAVLGERDAKIDARTGEERWPGRDGARFIARALTQAWGRPVHFLLPPVDSGCKDLRDFYHALKRKAGEP